MKRTKHNPPGNKGKQINSLKNKAPELNDDPMRHHPPTPQDIKRVQPLSQSNFRNHPGKSVRTHRGIK